MNSLFAKNLLEAKILNDMVSKDASFSTVFDKAVSVALKAYRHKHKILFAGNGGSAADAQHMATELVSRFYLERQALPAMALSINASTLTAIGNDYSFDCVFSRQLEAFGTKGDVFVGITTSGNSKNIIQAITTAKKLGIFTIVLTGKDGGEIASKNVADLLLIVPSQNTPRIQEIHEIFLHSFCEAIEKRLFGTKRH